MRCRVKAGLVGAVMAAGMFASGWGTAPASAQTRCADGTLSDSTGPGTCSWHGGIAGNERDDRPRGSSSGGGQGRIRDDRWDDDDTSSGIEIPSWVWWTGAAAAGGYWLWSVNDSSSGSTRTAAPPPTAPSSEPKPTPRPTSAPAARVTSTPQTPTPRSANPADRSRPSANPARSTTRRFNTLPAEGSARAITPEQARAELERRKVPRDRRPRSTDRATFRLSGAELRAIAGRARQ